MNGSPRGKRTTEYLKFRPYEVIGAPSVAKAAGHAVLAAAVKGGVIALIFVGIPSLFLVPVLTFFLSEFADLPAFLRQAGWNFLIPAALMAVLAVVSGAVSLLRR